MRDRTDRLPSDRLDRPLRDLRISVTDRCNMRCRYCMPRDVFGPGFRFLPRDELLSFDELARLGRIAARLGVRKIRLTGGEPLLRRELETLVQMLAAVAGIEEVAMTTNGLLLAPMARALADAGLRRVTVSLDALDDEVLETINDGPVSAARVLAGIEAALEAGLEPVKVNMVVRRGVNDHCIAPMAEHFRGRGVVLRFIEYMDVGTSNGWRAEEVVTGSEIVREIASLWPLEALEPRASGEVATRYRYLDGGGEIGVIQSVSEPFCGGCVRARVAADGKLFTCLFARRGSDLRSLLRGGANDEEIEDALRSIWRARSDRYSADRARRARAGQAHGRSGGSRTTRGAAAEPKIEMSYIGG
jgi:cyclic pyranopterin phosphate synthase